MLRPIYLDYMATTPVDSRVVAKMQNYFTRDGIFANPASTHVYGQAASAAVAEARAQVANLIGATSDEIIWTSGATEANNLALKGAAQFYARQGKHIITCASEHKAVLACCRYLETLGFAVTYLAPERDGAIDLLKLENAVRHDTILVSLMHVNNEIGVIHDIAAIGKMTRERGILLHVDAAQSVGKIPVDVAAMRIDLLSFTAHKFYGPKGIGALYVRGNPRLHLVPQVHGGGQERNLRSGTLPVAQIVGMGEACNIAAAEMFSENARILAWRNLFWQHLEKLGDVQVNGNLLHRIAGNLNISFNDIDGEVLRAALTDVAISSGAACGAGDFAPSHVLLAIGVPHQLAVNALRFSFGRFTGEEEILFAAEHVCDVVTKLRRK